MKHITRAMCKKVALWRSYRRNKTPANMAAYSRQVDVCKSLSSLLRSYSKTRVINRSNVGAFYRFVNKRLVVPSGIHPQHFCVCMSKRIMDESSDGDNCLYRGRGEGPGR